MWKIVFAVLIILLAPGAVAGSGTFTAASPADFLNGLLHGFIMVFSFLASLMSPDFAVYEIQNTGVMYDFGFVLGALFFFTRPARKGVDFILPRRKDKPPERVHLTEEEWKAIEKKLEKELQADLKKLKSKKKKKKRKKKSKKKSKKSSKKKKKSSKKKKAKKKKSKKSSKKKKKSSKKKKS